MLSGCDQNVTVSGVVRAQADAALAGVGVTLETNRRAPHTSMTAADGSYSVGMVGADPKQTTIQFEKPGYQTVKQPIGANARTTLNVTLSPVGVGAPPDPHHP